MNRPTISPSGLAELCQPWATVAQAQDATRMAEQCGWPVERHEPPEELVKGSGVWAVATVPMPDAPARYITYFDAPATKDPTP